MHALVIKVLIIVLFTINVQNTSCFAGETNMSSSKKSTVLAGSLSAFVGFGTGHWYAQGRWTKDATKFLVVDAAAWGALIYGSKLIGSPGPSHHPSMAFIGLVVIFGLAKVWQTADSIQFAQGAGESNDQANKIQNNNS